MAYYDSVNKNLLIQNYSVIFKNLFLIERLLYEILISSS